MRGVGNNSIKMSNFALKLLKFKCAKKQTLNYIDYDKKEKIHHL